MAQGAVLAGGRLVGGREGVVAGAATFGAVHLGVGLIEEGFGVDRRIGVAGDADAGADVGDLLADGDGGDDGGGEPFHEEDRGAVVGARFQQDGELVAAEPRDGRVGGGAAAQAAGGGDQGDVPGGVAEAVVDRLEAVEVDEEDGGVARSGGEGVGQVAQEVGTVGEAGQGVVLGLVAEVDFERALLVMSRKVPQVPASPAASAWRWRLPATMMRRPSRVRKVVSNGGRVSPARRRASPCW